MSSVVRFVYEDIPIDQINPMPDNPRRVDGRLLDQLDRSMETYGLTVPLVFNRRTGNLVSGHQRYRVLLKQQQTSVYCAVIDVDRAAERGLVIALNHLKGRWDNDKLASVLHDIEADVDLFVSGFNSAEVDYILGRTRRANTRDAPEGDFLDQFINDIPEDPDPPSPADHTPRNDDRILSPDPQADTSDAPPIEDYTILFLDMPVMYRDRVFESMQKAGEAYGATNSLEELVVLCQAFLDEGPFQYIQEDADNASS